MKEGNNLEPHYEIDAALAKKRIAQWERNNPTLAQTCAEVYKGRWYPTLAERWQTAFTEWGPVSLKFRYPDVPKRTAGERRAYTQARRKDRRWLEMKSKRDSERLLKKLESDRLRYWSKKSYGLHLPRALIRDLHSQNEYAYEAQALLMHQVYDGGMHQWIG